MTSGKRVTERTLRRTEEFISKQKGLFTRSNALAGCTCTSATMDLCLQKLIAEGKVVRFKTLSQDRYASVEHCEFEFKAKRIRIKKAIVETLREQGE